jgi:hypothetical protein
MKCSLLHTKKKGGPLFPAKMATTPPSPNNPKKGGVFLENDPESFHLLLNAPKWLQMHL